MASLVSSDSESSSDSEEPAIETRGKGKISQYEKQRLKRIEENRARMEALGLGKMTASLMGSISKAHKKVADKKGKKKVGAHAEEDDEYKPSEGEEGFSSSAEEDENDNGGDGFSKSVSNKCKIKKSTPKKGAPNNQPVSESDFMNDDDALMQAIALSLQDSAGFLDVSKAPNKSAGAHITGENHREKKVDSSTPEGTGKRKRKQSIRNRVQMTEDEFILHFFQFDEAGKGSISVRDLRRVAAAHDFLWSDEELGDMIHCFDVDGDGKLSLEEFRKIVIRCNMMISVG
ncbi:centrin-2-like isoform X2 [Ipomoea triloba]|uniref:centrin-2-like isoform X2 n=1 Tax=Ipomoea triloba TaxID=35885 RepID=UPI00125D48A8|nr:centrin-2-like isoform X2 [Ipomoea triloba]